MTSHQIHHSAWREPNRHLEHSSGVKLDENHTDTGEPWENLAKNREDDGENPPDT